MNLEKLSSFISRKCYPLQFWSLFGICFLIVYVISVLIFLLLEQRFSISIIFLSLGLAGAASAQFTISIQIFKRTEKFNSLLKEANEKAKEAKSIDELSDIWFEFFPQLDSVAYMDQHQKLSEFERHINYLQSSLRIDELYTVEDQLVQIQDVLNDVAEIGLETGEAIFKIKKILKWEWTGDAN